MRIRVAFAHCSTRTGRIRCTAWRERRDRSRCRSSRELLTLCGVLRASTELALLPNATLRRMLTSTALTSTTPLVDAPPLGPSRHSPRSRPPQRPHIRPAIRASRASPAPCPTPRAAGELVADLWDRRCLCLDGPACLPSPTECLHPDVPVPCPAGIDPASCRVKCQPCKVRASVELCASGAGLADNAKMCTGGERILADTRMCTKICERP